MLTIDDDTNIWYNTVIRADVNYVKIGKKCNIQDGTVIHVSSYGFSANGKKGSPTILHNNVTIGHNATIHACEIKSNCLVGMGSVILDKAVLEEFSICCCRCNNYAWNKSQSQRTLGGQSRQICKKNIRDRGKITY